jgi:peroxiredoxin
MKIIFFVTICLILTSSFGQAKNNESTTNYLEIDYLKGLHKFKGSEEFTITPDIKYYTEIGTKLTHIDIKRMSRSENNSFDFYVNDSNKLKAIVVRTATEKEKLAFKKMAGEEGIEGKFIGQLAKPFGAIDIKGYRFGPKQLQGKIIVLHFWMFDCPPCLESLKGLNNIVKEYKEKDIIVLGITLRKKEEINNFFYKSEFKFSIIPDGVDLINSFDIDSYPTHLIINKDSKITFFYEGLSQFTIGNLKMEIERLLKL